MKYRIYFKLCYKITQCYIWKSTLQPRCFFRLLSKSVGADRLKISIKLKFYWFLNNLFDSSWFHNLILNAISNLVKQSFSQNLCLYTYVCYVKTNFDKTFTKVLSCNFWEKNLNMESQHFLHTYTCKFQQFSRKLFLVSMFYIGQVVKALLLEFLRQFTIFV